jgi:hypothetical protein
MIDQNNPHTLHQSGYMASFFKENTAVGVKDNWDACSISCWSSGGQLHLDVTDKNMYHALVGLLECVYHSGEFNAKKEIRKILGVKE